MKLPQIPGQDKVSRTEIAVDPIEASLAPREKQAYVVPGCDPT